MQEFENVWKLKKFDRQMSAQFAEELNVTVPAPGLTVPPLFVQLLFTVHAAGKVTLAPEFICTL